MRLTATHGCLQRPDAGKACRPSQPGHGAERLRPRDPWFFRGVWNGAALLALECARVKRGSADVLARIDHGQMYSAGSIANRKWGAWVRGVLPGAAAALRTGSGIPPSTGPGAGVRGLPPASARVRAVGFSRCPRRSRNAEARPAVARAGRGHGESPAMAARASTTSEAQCGGEGSGGKPPHRFPKPTPRRRRRIVADAADQGARRLARDSGR